MYYKLLGTDTYSINIYLTGLPVRIHTSKLCDTVTSFIEAQFPIDHSWSYKGATGFKFYPFTKFVSL